MTYDKDRIYQDTVEIVKAAVSSSSDSNYLVSTHCIGYIENYIKTVYKTLCEINDDK